MSTLLTGAAGFIGMHTALRLLDAGEKVVGVDNFDPYYDPKLKESRASVLLKSDFNVSVGNDALHTAMVHVH